MKPFKLYLFVRLQIFVANPNKPQEVKIILARNHEKLLELLHNLSPGKGNTNSNCSILIYKHHPDLFHYLKSCIGSEDDQFEEEKELIIEEIQKMSRLKNLEL